MDGMNVKQDQSVYDRGYSYPSEDELKMIFVSSCAESVARKLKVPAQEVYLRMKRVGLIHNYILSNYEVIHSESRQAITDDITQTLLLWEKKGGEA